ncbi:MAG: Proline--tRNA ligase [Methanosaeta sp. PtaB.Bin039]|nr:MAG: Proline--tRNA ligase [Methanosaeta sp. PtaB.Bin039]OPY47658.1 MAG: Proline--tRNA ligase [Methanosaeta sp. PtaU1.Bin028]HOT06741.1 proline--tRNA ligase [Methanotrichaceae archaeon]HQF16391.1 proline--tRNA ligase [Methanotrichaceae archaeon]HQI90995.1 proline--tRNA ligase [Methanotrichaceae archaeon]
MDPNSQDVSSDVKKGQGRGQDSRPESKEAKLPPKSSFSEWYHELLKAAEIIDVRYPVKGMCVWFPFGFALRRSVYGIIRELLDPDHYETQFPLLIPEQEFMKEADHIKGFEDEVYWVTHGGTSPLDVKLALRPTSETAIYPMFKLWIRSHADLPLKVYQIINTFRYETKHTRPLIRLREITSFKEAHTAHATWDEAAEQVEVAVKRYAEFYRRLAVPFLESKRPSWDKFPGADYSIALDVVMPDGRTLQVGTAHLLGTNFARTYEITYEDQKGEQQYVNQSCYGISERCIAALISVHGDDRGLILPWLVAPTQVVIVPIIFGEKEPILEACRQLEGALKQDRIRVVLDGSDERPGAKFYKWELRGVPIRLELGPRDIKNGVVTMVRRDGVKKTVPISDVRSAVVKEAEDLSAVLYSRALELMKSKIKDVHNVEEAREQTLIGVARAAWCGSVDCGHEMEDRVGANLLGEARDGQQQPDRPCLICGKQTFATTYLARQY